MSIRSLPALVRLGLLCATVSLLCWLALWLQARLALTPQALTPQALTDSSPSISSRASDTSGHELAEEHRALQAGQLTASSGAHLESLYVDCAVETSTHRMDADEELFCQAVADVLTHRVFGGRVEDLLSLSQRLSGQDRSR